MMGSPLTEAGGQWDEELHRVILTHDFYMKDTPVTQLEFQILVGHNPSFYDECGHDCPVDDITWHDAVYYCNLMSEEAQLPQCYDCVEEDGKKKCELSKKRYITPYDCPGYRLPTEAEWEYAARAGTQTATYNGDLTNETLHCEMPNPVLDPIAWFCGNVDGKPHPVAQKKPNDFGLYDMSGLTWEWCYDWYEEYPTVEVKDPDGPLYATKRVIRGGDQSGDARLARSANRLDLFPSDHMIDLSFRPVRTAID